MNNTPPGRLAAQVERAHKTLHAPKRVRELELEVKQLRRELELYSTVYRKPTCTCPCGKGTNPSCPIHP